MLLSHIYNSATLNYGDEMEKLPTFGRYNKLFVGCFINSNVRNASNIIREKERKKERACSKSIWK